VAITEPHWRSRLLHDGYAIVKDVISPSHVESLRDAFAALARSPAVRRRKNVFGVRNLFELVPATKDLVQESAIRDLVEPVLGPDAFAVRGIFFDKPADANWHVPWHQDLTIAVAERVDCDGFGPWSVKAGVPHVQPPADVLSAMLTVRVHLDRCDRTNGALRVLPGSHVHGRLTPQDVATWRTTTAEAFCDAAAGDVLLMRPLLLHASSPSAAPEHRRVVHLDFCASELPSELRWHEQIPLTVPSGAMETDGVNVRS